MTRHDSWKIYTIILDKELAAKKMPKLIDKDRLYNVLANHLLKQVKLSDIAVFNLFVDRSKDCDGIIEFDSLLRSNLNTILPLNVPLNISHTCSHNSHGIQAVDLFWWGIFRKYEQADNKWYDIFKTKVVYEEEFGV